MLIKDPLTELLAIMLYEHDSIGRKHMNPTTWISIAEEDRELYRKIARGEEEMATIEDKKVT